MQQFAPAAALFGEYERTYRGAKDALGSLDGDLSAVVESSSAKKAVLDGEKGALVGQKAAFTGKNADSQGKNSASDGETDSEKEPRRRASAPGGSFASSPSFATLLATNDADVELVTFFEALAGDSDSPASSMRGSTANGATWNDIWTRSEIALPSVGAVAPVTTAGAIEYVPDVAAKKHRETCEEFIEKGGAPPGWVPETHARTK